MQTLWSLGVNANSPKRTPRPDRAFVRQRRLAHLAEEVPGERRTDLALEVALCRGLDKVLGDWNGTTDASSSASPRALKVRGQ